ncbi:transposase, MuDR, MULE transposase domain protein [Tanacetum coccineum]
MMNESHEDSFSQFSYYCYNLKLANEGTVTHIHTDANGSFEMLYDGFGFAIRSFLRYMRPLIIINGAHLKGNYSRTNLLAVGMDGNNQILPLATGCLRAFDKAICELRAYRPEAVNKLEQAGIEKWSRAYCPSSRYNYMTSNNVESINSLTRVVRRVPITMLVEYCRDLLQRWYCEKRHRYAQAPVHKLSDWATAKVNDKMLKSAKWTVKGIDHLQLYQVSNTKEVHQAKPWFTKTTLKDTYQELVNPLKDPKLWETPNDLQVVLPPIMNKRPAGRPKNKDRIRSTNEALTLASCTRCGMNGHNRNGCNQPFPTNDARLDEERLQNGRIYMDWIDYEATELLIIYTFSAILRCNSCLAATIFIALRMSAPVSLSRISRPWSTIGLSGCEPNLIISALRSSGIFNEAANTVETSIQTQHTVRIIPGPAGIVQSAMQLKQIDTLIGRDEDRMSTQEYMKEVIEDVGEDEGFKSAPWVSAADYVNANGGIVSGCLGDIYKYLNNGKLDLVVAIVKSCSPNVIGDLTITMKHPSSKIPRTIHYKVLDEGTYGKDITIGASMILTNVSVFTPKPSVHYLNITRRNVVQVFCKDTVHASDSV